MLAGCLAALALAGCSTSLRATAAPGSPSAAPSSGAATTAPPAPSQSPTPRPGVATCRLANLKVTTGEGDAGSGHWSLPLVFRNTGTATCRLRGYPGVAGLDATGAQATQARRTPSGYLGGVTDPASLPVVDLAPGATGSALLEGASHPDTAAGGPCFQYPALLVTSPDETHSVRVDQTVTTCTDLQIHPVVPGDTGSQSR
jgi:Domain of unknown function (DUF4232)